MRYSIKDIVLLLCCLVSFPGVAQIPGYKIYSISNEFQQQPRINTICQLNNGYILLGTTKGVYKFDGINFDTLQKAPGVPDEVTSIWEIKNNDIWLGFRDGSIGRLNNNRVELVSFEEGHPKVAITKIIVDSTNTVWMGTAGEGIYFYRNNKIYNINLDDGLSDNYVYDIVALSSNHILVATDKGLNECTSDIKHKVTSTFTSRNGLPDNIVRCLSVAGNKDIWLGMQDGGISRYDTTGAEALKTTNWQYGQVNAILFASSRLFVATEDKGLLLFNYNITTKSTTFAGSDEQLKKITCLLRDKEGNTWVAGNNQLMRLAGSAIVNILTLDKKTSENVHSLLWAKDSSLWLNTTSGVLQLRNLNNGVQQQNIVVPYANGMNISALYEDILGNIWIGTMGKGIIILDPRKGSLRQLKEIPELINANIISMSGKDSIIWISALEGTVRATLHNNKIGFTSYSNVESIGNKYVYSILTDNAGSVWFATDGKGIIHYNNGKFSDLKPTRQDYGNVVYKIVEDKNNNLWFSTYNKGLIKYSGKTFTAFTTEHGLSDMNISGLTISDDNIFLLHKNSIDIVNTDNSSMISFDKEQGISNINTDLNTLTSDVSGNVYFIADNKIYRYNANNSIGMHPIVMIDKIQLFLRDTVVQNEYAFKHNENNLSFHYTGLFYTQPDKIQYQYKLEGYDKDWTTTKDRIKNFPQLPPGTYTFRVRVSLNQHFLNSYEAAFKFTILKPFWQQLWFILLSVFSLAALLYFIIKQREKSIEKYNRLEREKIQSQLETLRNQINPHFLFNSFNTLASEIEEHPDKAVTYVERLSDFYRSIVVYREKDLISLEEEINILNDYCFIQQKRYGCALQIDIAVSEIQQRTYCIVPLALQLLFENAVKHNIVSTQHPLHIDLYINGEDQLIVRNNINKKFNQEKGSSMGLQNIQKRYLLLRNKTVKVENDDRFFTVKIPLIKI